MEVSIWDWPGAAGVVVVENGTSRQGERLASEEKPGELASLIHSEPNEASQQCGMRLLKASVVYGGIAGEPVEALSRM